MSGRGRKVVRKETGSTGASRNIAPRLCSRSCNACASFLSQGLQRRSRRGLRRRSKRKNFVPDFGVRTAFCAEHGRLLRDVIVEIQWPKSQERQRGLETRIGK